jgi:thioredoxin reductase (NADPH)
MIVCVDDDPIALGQVEHELTKRYGADYELRLATSGASAVALVQSLASERRELALVIVDEAMPDSTGIDVLTQTRLLCPGTQRALLVGAWDRPMQGSVLRAATLGVIDCWLVKPTAVGLIEEFHHSVAAALYSWSRLNRPFEWVRMVGAAWSPQSYVIRDLLARNRVPFGFYDAASEDGQRVLDEVGASADRLPVLVIGEGEVLVQPSFATLASALGGQTRPRSASYDVVVIGAGPAGLAAAVYAASEGLSTLVVEREAIGGQAGTSSLIRNYLGFPLGISGAELALRAFHQAILFGVEFVFANRVVGLAPDRDELVIALSDGGEAHGRSVVIACGVNYRRLGIPELERRIGAGVYYGAATTEAEAMTGLDVCVVGGGNSAGQAALKLAQHAKHVAVLVRGPSLAESMSEYLIRDLERTPNIDVRFNVEVVDGEVEPRLETLTVRDLVSGNDEIVATSALFVLIGAEPTTDWLPLALRKDRWGYLLTGADAYPSAAPEGTPTPTQFETTIPGVYAVGDVRHGSTKRVAAAVAEGSVCIRLVHQHLAPTT